MSRILLVDDEKDILELMRYALELNGHTVEVAECIASAWKILIKKPMDIIITDFRLNGRETGLDLVRLLQKGKLGAIRTALITGSLEINPESNEGSDRVFHKPFAMKEVLSWVNES